MWGFLALPGGCSGRPFDSLSASFKMSLFPMGDMPAVFHRFEGDALEATGTPALLPIADTSNTSESTSPSWVKEVVAFLFFFV